MIDNLKYQFVLESGWGKPDGVRQVFTPLNASEFKITEKKATPYSFRRVNFSGTVILFGQDYSLIKDIEDGKKLSKCSILFFIINENTGTESKPKWEQVWKGYFNIIDCTFDLDCCHCEFTPTVYDKYTPVLPHIDDDVNLFEAKESATCDAIYQSSNFEYLLGVSDTKHLNSINHHKKKGCYYIDDIDASTNEPFYKSPASGYTETNVAAYKTLSNTNNYGWMLFYETISIQDYTPKQYWRVFSKWIREYEINDSFTVAPAGTGWQYEASVTVGNTTRHKWVRQPFDGLYNNYTIGGSPCNNWAVIKFTLDLTATSITVSYNKGRSLWSCFELIAEKLGLNGFVSGFFNIYNSILAEEQNIIDRHLRYTQVHSVVDMKSPTSDDPNPDWTIRISDFLNAICNMFNCAWFIVSLANGNFLSLEHISDTEFNQGTAVTDLNIIDGGFASNYMRKYSYIKEELIHRERWSINPEMSYEDFKGKDIIYDRVCSYFRQAQNVKDYNCGRVITDMQLLYSTPANVSDDSLMIVDVEPLDGYFAGRTVRYASGKITGNYIINGNFSLANLHYDFWRKGRILNKGSMNGIETDFLTYKKQKKQTVKVLSCSDIPFKNITRTKIGDGEIETKILSLITNEYELTIIYP